MSFVYDAGDVVIVMKKAVLFLLLSIFVHAIDTNFWDYSFQTELKKDEIYRLSVDDTEIVKQLYFRWTLYHNEGLVLLVNYDGHPHQFILYDRYNEDSVRLKIARKVRYSTHAPFLLLIFKEFDFSTRKAQFEILVKDTSKKLAVKEE